MIYGYFDESGCKNKPFVVIAGYVGRLKDWGKYLQMWRKEMGGRPSLHLADMRLGSRSADRKYGDLLRRLGSVPGRANLRAFAGSVWTAPHAERIKRTIAEIGLSGYSVALTAMVDAVLQSEGLPKSERIEFTFEDQLEFAVPRAATLRAFRQSDQHKTCPGNRSRVGKERSMEKGPLLEASDYLSYALLQQLLEPNSQKAKLTKPIIECSQPIGHTMVDDVNMASLIEHTYGGDIPRMDRYRRAFIIQEMKKSLNH